MPVWSGMRLACKLVLASSGRTKTVLDLHRVFDVVVDHCIIKDRVDHCSS